MDFSSSHPNCIPCLTRYNTATFGASRLHLVWVAWSRPAPSCITAIRSFSVSDANRSPPKARQPLADLVDVASLRAAYGNRLCCRLRKQCWTVGIDFQWMHSPLHIWDGAHIKDGRWKRLVQLHNASSFHWTWTGQVQHFKGWGAVEHQLNSYVILATSATAYWYSRWKFREIKLGQGKTTLFKKDVCWVVQDNGYGALWAKYPANTVYIMDNHG